MRFTLPTSIGGTSLACSSRLEPRPATSTVADNPPSPSAASASARVRKKTSSGSASTPRAESASPICSTARRMTGHAIVSSRTWEPLESHDQHPSHDDQLTLREFFASNLPEEEEHVNWLETELSLIDEVGDATTSPSKSTSWRELLGDARAAGPRSHKGFRTVCVETRLPAQATRHNVGRSTRP
jgi:hypothetical protein